MNANERLAEIRARAEATTAGPWGWAGHTTVDGDEWAVFAPQGYALAVNRDGWVPDANFIAHARTDVPALVAALEAVLELHQPTEIQVMTEEDCLSDECGHPDMNDCPDGPFDRCAGCVGYMAHPCPTVTAINEALGENL